MSAMEEIAAWKASLSSAKKKDGTVPTTLLEIKVATSAFVTFQYERTPYIKGKVTLTFPEKYPTQASLIVSVDGLAPGLCKKLQREMEQVAKDSLLVPSSKNPDDTNDTTSTPQQIQPVVQYFTQFLDTNQFVPCWKEVRKLVDMAQQPSSLVKVLALHETQGVIRLKLTSSSGDYFYDSKLTINPSYPSTSNLEDPLQLTRVKSNFPSAMEDVMAKHAKGFVRLLQDGVQVQEAWTRSNPVALPSTNESNTTTTNSQAASGDPIPSLLPVVSMLQSKLMSLPETKCAMCQTNLLPAKPADLAALYDKTSKKTKQQQQRPIYSACGCWFHYQCLHRVLTEPPFGVQCPVCRRERAYHPDWSADVQAYQRAYTAQQARQREIDDVAMMF